MVEYFLSSLLFCINWLCFFSCREVEDFARRLNSNWPERMQILSLGQDRRLVPISMNSNGSTRLCTSMFFLLSSQYLLLEPYLLPLVSVRSIWEFFSGSISSNKTWLRLRLDKQLWYFSCICQLFSRTCAFSWGGYWACNLWHIQVLIGDSANQHRRIIQFPGRVEVEAIWKDDSLGFAVVWILKAQVFLWTPCECYLFVLCDFQPKCSFFYFNLEHFEFKQGERGKLKEIKKTVREEEWRNYWKAIWA